MIRILLYGKQIFDKFSRDEMSVYAAQASFFIILAAFPFMMLLLSLIQLVPFIQKSDLFLVLTELVPDTLDSFVITLVDTLYSDSPVAILSATAVVVLPRDVKHRAGPKPGLRRGGAEKLYFKAAHMQRLHRGFQPRLRHQPPASCVRRDAPEASSRGLPVLKPLFRPDFPGAGRVLPVHARDFFRRHLYVPAL